MRKHILFLIHGIGIHETTWAEEPDGPIETLKRASRQYSYFKNKELEDKVEFAPIHYDEVFLEIVSQWQSDATKIDQWDTSGVLKGSLTWLEAAGEKEKNFWWSHVADVAMYRFFPLYRQRVRIHVIDQLAKKIEQAMDSEGEATCSVLAHSMGTAVAHDCLHLLGTIRWGNQANPLNPAHWRFNHLFMVANTSRLLQTEDHEMKKAYESIVRPGPVEEPDSYCATYWNFRHEADPVPFPRMFEPVGWRNYTSIVVRHYREASIHNLSYYLQNPRIHIPVLIKVVSPKAVLPEEEVEAVNPDRFPQFGGDLAFIQKAKDMAAKLEAVKNSMGDDPGPYEWLRGLVKFYELMDGCR